ncbi:MAG: PD-(D/E)XK nuclease family protein, partial [Phascolarctobacterium sp.]|nr:PD-(D/E)XK nuclease family protein [Candidatus Phascolarctobacterium equi]
DMVQIMTVHKSKGLGFDCVFVPFLAEEKARGEGDEKEQDAFERRRLLYVAMTRAKKYLYMSASAHNLEKCLAKPSAGAWLWRALHKPKEIPPTGRQRKSRWGWEQFENLVEGTIKEQGVRVEGQGLRSEELINPSVACGTSCVRWTQFNPQQGSQAVVSAFPSRTTFTPTMLQIYLHCPRSYYYCYVCGLPEVDSTSSCLPLEGKVPKADEVNNLFADGSSLMADNLTPAEMGTLIHSALEHYDGDVEMAWASALRAQGSGFRTQDSGVNFAKTLFVNYVNSNLFKQIPRQHDREVKFQLPIDDGVSFQGIMDCVYQKPDGNYGVVDYKTGVMPNEENKGYAMQLAIYGEAVSKMYCGAEVSELALHYLQGCVAKPVDSGKLQDAINLAKEMQKGHVEADFNCNEKQCAHCGYQYLCRKGGK